MWLDKNEEEFEWVKIEREIFKIVRDKNGDGKMDFEEVKNWIMLFLFLFLIVLNVSRLVLIYLGFFLFLFGYMFFEILEMVLINE